jgi:hypothetical protein
MGLRLFTVENYKKSEEERGLDRLNANAKKRFGLPKAIVSDTCEVLKTSQVFPKQFDTFNLLEVAMAAQRTENSHSQLCPCRHRHKRTPGNRLPLQAP